MNAQMQFPEKWEDFVMENTFTDHKQVYTNGLDLMTMSDVGLMMQHYLKIEQEKVNTLIQEKQEWIPWYEKLPEKEGLYLCTRDGFKGERIMEVIRFDDRGDGQFKGMWSVLAWMPLPEPYKERED